MKLLMCLCAIASIASVSGQRITTIQLDGVQYFVSRMNPYSPELNYFLSYQYCRSLGLQLASFETKEKVESMTQYLLNAGFSQYDFWTSGNRLGTGMFLWMSTGLPFNATFDYFEDSKDSVQAGLLDPIDHNSNTSPQRTARDSSSGLDKGCVRLKAPSLRWAPDDCSVVKDFICEQTRCYYYNYGSIPVSSSQGRPISQLSSTTTEAPTSFTVSSTPLPMLLMSTTMPPAMNAEPQTTTMADEELAPTSGEVTEDEDMNNAKEDNQEEHIETTTTVEQRLKQISEEIEKFSSNTDTEDEIGRQSFFSLSDLIKTLRPNDKKIPQIDSDYSNTMRVLGETTSLDDGGRKLKDSSEITNRALN